MSECVTRLGEEDIKQASYLLAEAFVDSPIYYAIFQGEKEWRMKAMATFFQINLRVMQDRGDVCRLWKSKETGEAETFFMLVPPGIRLSVPTLMYLILILLLPRFGFFFVYRLLCVVFTCEGDEDK
eukprot:CAMPEP_0184321046 /NCGR_PEP_ID=MMETSP1049-20130417/117100_1 /TAXON_ID=77928 /ORGANISM="Proteomonas sulcata, Strain CCMP704" /LENGTH=125 /DNA_ID=CAMNT_0026641729 /DNA_START=15 /DNA_END=389 /DNA_ORIENTATION=+